MEPIITFEQFGITFCIVVAAAYIFDSWLQGKDIE